MFALETKTTKRQDQTKGKQKRLLVEESLQCVPCRNRAYHSTKRDKHQQFQDFRKSRAFFNFFFFKKISTYTFFEKNIKKLPKTFQSNIEKHVQLFVAMEQSICWRIFQLFRKSYVCIRESIN